MSSDLQAWLSHVKECNPLLIRFMTCKHGNNMEVQGRWCVCDHMDRCCTDKWLCHQEQRPESQRTQHASFTIQLLDLMLKQLKTRCISFILTHWLLDKLLCPVSRFE